MLETRRRLFGGLCLRWEATREWVEISRSRGVLLGTDKSKLMCYFNTQRQVEQIGRECSRCVKKEVVWRDAGYPWISSVNDSWRLVHCSMTSAKSIILVWFFLFFCLSACVCSSLHQRGNRSRIQCAKVTDKTACGLTTLHPPMIDRNATAKLANEIGHQAQMSPLSSHSISTHRVGLAWLSLNAFITLVFFRSIRLIIML